MNTTTLSLQDSWQTNVYFLSITRVLMALGLTFLIRSFYQLYQRMRSTPSNAAARGADVIETLALGALEDGAMFGSGPDNGINEMPEITLPQPTYSPRGRL